jgi:cytochrome c peroxidase
MKAITILALLISIYLLAAFSADRRSISLAEDFELKVPLGFPVPSIPSDNKITKDRVKLGKKLFFDNILSSNNSISCGSCHASQNAFSDNKQFSVGVNDSIGERNAMPIINLAWANSFMWDGGVASLEMQIINPLTHPKEMNAPVNMVIERLKQRPEYVTLFKKAYGSSPDAAGIFKAIACFERTLISSNSKFDKFYYGKDQSAFNESELKGYYLFYSDQTHCSSCHTGFNFTNNTFQNNGLYEEYKDQGRYKITFNASDKGKFKVPTLRNVAVTAPYMHDGSIKTLEEVVDHYNSGGKNHINKSSHIHNNDSPPLTAEEKTALIDFMKALTDEDFINDPELKQ